jgi:hypothetical protein
MGGVREVYHPSRSWNPGVFNSYFNLSFVTSNGIDNQLLICYTIYRVTNRKENMNQETLHLWNIVKEHLDDNGLEEIWNNYPELREEAERIRRQKFHHERFMKAANQ